MIAQQQKKPKCARSLALLALQKIIAEGAYANLALSQLLRVSELSPADKRLATQLVNGSIRMQAAVDEILRQLLNRPLNKLPLMIHLILRISLYQLVYLERIPAAAAVHEGVELAKRYGHAGTVKLVNGVLRSYLREQKAGRQFLPTLEQDLRGYLTLTCSYPSWLIDELLQLWPAQEVIDFCHYHNQHQGLILRVNSLATSREALLQSLAEQGIAAEPARYAPQGVVLPPGIEEPQNLLKGATCLVQGEASQLVALALDPKPGSRVLDLCAAPGGKTTHLAELMADRGQIIALDLHDHRVRLIAENTARLGLQSIETLVADGRYLPPSYHRSFDYLLLDAPCSGLGVLGQRSDARWRKEAADSEALSQLAYELLLAAADYLKPGGVLLYSTCTIMPAENEDAIRRFLAARTDFSLSPLDKLADILPNAADQAAAQSGMLQLLPQRHGVEGFFYARLVKSGI